MTYEEIFSIGFDRSYGGCSYKIIGRKTKLTREELHEIIITTHYALEELDKLETELAD